MEELFNGQLSFADIDAEKFLHVRRAHADRRVNAMDRLTDDVINGRGICKITNSRCKMRDTGVCPYN